MSSQRSPDWGGQESPTAPEFELPGLGGTGCSLHKPGDFTTEGVGILGFFPFDALETAAPLTWLQFTEGINVVVVTDAPTSALDSEPARSLRSVSLMSDPGATVADDYGVDYQELASCKIFMLNTANEIVHTWSATEDPKQIHAQALDHVEPRESFTQQGGT